MKSRRIWRTGLIALGILAGAWAFAALLLPVLWPFLIGLAVSLLAEKPVRLLQTRARFPRWLASGVCVLTLFVLLFGGAFFLCRLLCTEAADLARQLPQLAEALLRVVLRNGPAAVQDPHDETAMSEIMWAGSLSHNGLTGLGGNKDFAPHQLGHALSEKFDVYHGESLTAIWSSWARYVLDTDVSRFARFARNVWGVEAADDKEAALAGIAAQEAFFRSIGMPVRIPALSCGRQDEAGLADLASRCSYGRTRTIGTFRVLGYDDILAIYQLANNEE